MSAPVRMCSAPSSSMIAVPDVAWLPRIVRPVCEESSASTSRGKPFGNTGKGRSRTIPIISQCPVTESFPADASAIRPTAAGGGGGGGGGGRGGGRVGGGGGGGGGG